MSVTSLGGSFGRPCWSPRRRRVLSDAPDSSGRMGRPHLPTRIQPLELATQVTLLFILTWSPSARPRTSRRLRTAAAAVRAAVRFDVRVVVLEQVLFATAVTCTRAPPGARSTRSPRASSGVEHPGSAADLICVALIGLPLAKAMSRRARALVQLSTSELTFRRNFTESRVPVAIVSRTAGTVLHRAQRRHRRTPGRMSADLAGHPVTELSSSPELEDAAARLAAGQTAACGYRSVSFRATHAPRRNALTHRGPRGGVPAPSLHLVDVTGPQEMQERLEAERTYTRAVIETASSMILLTRLDGTVIAANPATTTLTGLTRKNWSGSHCGRCSCRVASVSRPRGVRLPEPAKRHWGGAPADQGRRPTAVVFSSATHRVSDDVPVTVVLSAMDVTAVRHSEGMVTIRCDRRGRSPSSALT